MRVKDIMTQDVITVGPETPVHKAARLMVDHAISGLPVVDGAGRLLGIVSEGDLILRQAPRERVPWWRLFFEDAERLARDYQKRAGTTVAEVMTREVVSVSPEAELPAAADVLDKHRVRRLPVVANGELVGIVSRGDLIKALATEPEPGVSLSDAQLVAEMRARVAEEPWTSVHGLVVRARDGVISLWGLVGSETERSALATMARSIDGVKGIEDHLLVKTELAYHYHYGA